MSQQPQPHNKPAQPDNKPAELDRAHSAHSHAPDSDAGRRSTDPRDSPRPPKLLDQVRQVIRLRHLSASTEKQYIGWIRRYIYFHNKQHPAQLGKEQVEQFLSHLAIDGNVAASTQNQALSALLLLYREVLKVNLPWLTDVIRARRPKRLPTCFSADEAAFTGQCRGSLRGPCPV